MAAGDDHDVGRLVGNHPRHDPLKINGNDLFASGKRSPIGVSLAVVDHGHRRNRRLSPPCKDLPLMAFTEI